jgi:hypothetical protein
MLPVDPSLGVADMEWIADRIRDCLAAPGI